MIILVFDERVETSGSTSDHSFVKESYANRGCDSGKERLGADPSSKSGTDFV